MFIRLKKLVMSMECQALRCRLPYFMRRFYGSHSWSAFRELCPVHSRWDGRSLCKEKRCSKSGLDTQLSCEQNEVMKLPHKKSTRLLISVLFTLFCWFIAAPFFFFLSQAFVLSKFYSLLLLLGPVFLVLPIAAVIFIWTRPRFTRSLEEERAGKKWDSVVDELKNRK